MSKPFNSTAVAQPAIQNEADLQAAIGTLSQAVRGKDLDFAIGAAMFAGGDTPEGQALARQIAKRRTGARKTAGPQNTVR